MPSKDKAKRRQQYLRQINRPGVREKRRETTKAWATANRDHLRAREAVRRLEKRALCLIATARTRARKRGLDFDLHDHVAAIQAKIDRGVCEVTGEPFDLSPGRKFNSPSLDRIDPTRGYTIDNVRVVLNLVNAALGDWGEGVLREVMTRWLGK